VHEDVSGGVLDNESLEFLGDAVIGFVVADRLFREFPDWDEGRKSKVKAMLVSTSSLARLGETLTLGEHLLLGRGEEKTGGRQKRSLMADTFEAVVAAIYLDGGFDAVDTFVGRLFRPLLEEARATGSVASVVTDHKSALQEYVQGQGLPLPDYRLVREIGPDHQKLFQIELSVGGQVIAEADGTSKKDAEQRAAEKGLGRLIKTPRIAD
jgi:ribonuclease III